MTEYLYSALQHYGAAILTAIFFLFFVYHYRTLSQETLRYFTSSTVSVLLLVAADGLHGYFALLDHPTGWRMFFAASAYTLRVCVLYFILMLFCRSRPKRSKFLLTLPVIANGLVSFSAFFFPSVFTYTAENELIRGPLISIPFAVSFFYFAAMVYEGIRNMKMGDRRETVLVLFIFGFATCTTVMEVLWSFHGALPTCCILGLVFYYMHFMSDHYSYDKLTDACIRNRLYEDARRLNEPYGVIAMDVNDLKRINDTCGHLMGDKALISVAHAARDCLPRYARLYRVGGDEFVIVCRTRREEQVRALEQQIRKAMSLTPYSASLGSAFRSEGETLETVVARADALLYLDKQHYRETNTEPRTPCEIL